MNKTTTIANSVYSGPSITVSMPNAGSDAERRRRRSGEDG